MKVILDQDGEPVFPPGTPELVQAEVRKALKQLDAGEFEEVNLEDLD